MRDKIINAINDEIDEYECLDAVRIADRILLDVPDIKKSFTDGYLAAVQFFAIDHGLDTQAVDALKASGIDKSELIISQEKSDYKTPQMMTRVINMLK